MGIAVIRFSFSLQHDSSMTEEAAVVVVEQNEAERIATIAVADAYHAEETVIATDSSLDGDVSQTSAYQDL